MTTGQQVLILEQKLEHAIQVYETTIRILGHSCECFYQDVSLKKPRKDTRMLNRYRVRHVCESCETRGRLLYEVRRAKSLLGRARRSYRENLKGIK